MAGRGAMLVRIAGVLLCVAAILHPCVAGRAFAAKLDGSDSEEPEPAEFGGKLTLELLGAQVEGELEDIGLGMSIEGKLRIPLGPAAHCELAAAVEPHPGTGAAEGSVSAEMRARAQSGVALEVSVRRGLSLEGDDPGDEGEECLLSSLASSVSWQGAGRWLYWRASYEAHNRVFPDRPTSDRREREAAASVRVRPLARLSMRADVTASGREYRLAAHNTSRSFISALTGSYDLGAGLSAEVEIERKDVRYPASQTKTYGQLSWEGSATYARASGWSLGCSLSHTRRSFPFAPSKDLFEREAAVEATLKRKGLGALTLEGAVFGRVVPASPGKEYQLTTLGAGYAFSPAPGLDVDCESVLSRKLYADPASRRGDYCEVRVSCELAKDLGSGLEVVGRTELKRREYPNRPADSTHRVESSLALVYRF